MGRSGYHRSNSTSKLTGYSTERWREKTCLLIDIVIPDTFQNTKGSEKLRMYKDLEIKVSRMWKVRTKIMPAIIGALGTIKSEPSVCCQVTGLP